MTQGRSDVKQEQILWRRQKVLELSADGYSIREIGATLKIPYSTIGKDILHLRAEAKEQIHKYITEQVPYEYKKTLAGLEGIIKFMSSIIADDSKDTKERMQAASIKMQALNMKMELVSSANLVEEAMDLVQQYHGYTTQKGKVLTDGNGKSA
jgi:hypothetical protein